MGDKRIKCMVLLYGERKDEMEINGQFKSQKRRFSFLNALCFFFHSSTCFSPLYLTTSRALSPSMIFFGFDVVVFFRFHFFVVVSPPGILLTTYKDNDARYYG